MLLTHAIVISTCLVYMTNAYSSGAPSTTCDTLLPAHGVTAQNKLEIPVPSPFQIRVQGGYMVENDGIVSMTLRAAGGRAFRGFVIVAEYVDLTNTRYRMGNWSSVSRHAKVACGNAEGLTHTDSSRKTSVTVQWQAPSAPFNGHVSFWGSFVEEKTKFWVELQGTKTINIVPVVATTTREEPRASVHVSQRTESSHTEATTRSEATQEPNTHRQPTEPTEAEKTTTIRAFTNKADEDIRWPSDPIPRGGDEQPNGPTQLLKKGKSRQINQDVSGGDKMQLSMLCFLAACIYQLL